MVYRETSYAFYSSTDPILFKKSVDRISNLKGIAKILPTYNELNVQMELISSIKKAFADIEDKHMIKHGNGIFEFGDFKIHI